MIDVLEAVSPENFDAEAYLAANPDVARASGEDAVGWARRHFQEYGHRESRMMFSRSGLEQIGRLREGKLDVLFERSPGTAARCERYTSGAYVVPSTVLRDRLASGLPIPMDNISANYYDQSLVDLFDSHPGELFLDLGAGLRRQYRQNVLNVEIDALPTTDVLAFGDRLPFDDAVFDGAVCLAVLEHVADPFLVAEELVRVVRPGGTIVVDWPFLQPVHGYPNHYFNATMEGAKAAFERLPAVGRVSGAVPPHMHPIFTLMWIAELWSSGLQGPALEEFRSSTVDDLLSRAPDRHLRETSWVVDLDPEVRSLIAAGSRLWVTRAPDESSPGPGEPTSARATGLSVDVSQLELGVVEDYAGLAEEHRTLVEEDRRAPAPVVDEPRVNRLLRRARHWRE